MTRAEGSPPEQPADTIVQPMAPSIRELWYRQSRQAGLIASMGGSPAVIHSRSAWALCLEHVATVTGGGPSTASPALGPLRARQRWTTDFP